jgi:hypothetical protein
LRKDGSTLLTSLHGPSGDAYIKPSLEKLISSEICNCNAKLTRCGPAFRGRSGCILDNLNQLANALDESLANHSMIQIVQLDIQTDLPRLRNR